VRLLNWKSVIAFSPERSLKSDIGTADNNDPSLRQREQLQVMTSSMLACAS
jgi:hypothetical protein